MHQYIHSSEIQDVVKSSPICHILNDCGERWRFLLQHYVNEIIIHSIIITEIKKTVDFK